MGQKWIVTDDSSGETFKNRVIAVLAGLFFLLYTMALLGWVKPLSDVMMIARLEPILFVLIGYYFGRVPSQQNERVLRQEIDRHSNKTDAAVYAKEITQLECEAFEERIRNARCLLSAEALRRSSNRVNREGELHSTVIAALRILDS